MMLTSTIRLGTLLVVCVILSSCNRNRPEWIDIPAIQGGTYVISVKTYQDNDSVAQPFKLGARSRHSKKIIQLLSAEQCKNVKVFQEEKEITVFYDILILDHFSGDSIGSEIPRILLCDNNVEVCQDRRKEYIRHGIKSASICMLH